MQKEIIKNKKFKLKNANMIENALKSEKETSIKKETNGNQYRYTT